MTTTASSPCIGLFGTCGGSSWRDAFITQFKQQGIDYFNPQVDDWTPELAEVEARHLIEDEIILFPVTGETYGTGSLAEIGFACLQASLNPNRQFIFFIEQDLDPSLDHEVTIKESKRARKLVAAHLKKVNLANVHSVDSLDAMRELSLKLAQ